jgi:dihydropteroate synthase
MGFIDQILFSDFQIGDFSPVRIMGVINLSPESFYNDSFIPNEEIITKIKNFHENGATFIDIGARSTAPGVKPISVEQEKKRVNDVLQILPSIFPKECVLSIDTQYSEIAEMSIEFAQKHEIKIVINDVSSFTTDPLLIDVVVKYQCPCIIMATNKTTGDAKTTTGILNALNRTITKLHDKGYDLKNLIIDPGVGKWVSEKTYEYDLEMLDQLECFRCFGFPILVGLSRKSFIGTILNEKNAKNREIGSLAATSIAIYNGAHIIRTHDVNLAMIQTINVASAIRKKPVTESINGQKCEILSPFSNENSSYYYLTMQSITSAGSRIMRAKMQTKIILLRNVTAPQGLILKQELLARGGDVALHRDVITTEWEKYDEKYDVVLIGTIKQINNLIQKLKGQQLKLDIIAQILENTLNDENNTKRYYSKAFKSQ